MIFLCSGAGRYSNARGPIKGFIVL